MNRVLICLIGKRTTHNVQFIKYFDGFYDQLVFLTTPQMERTDFNPSGWILNSLNIPEEEVKKVFISAYDIRETEAALKAENFSKEPTYYINITGGNKLMTLYTYSFFQNYNAKMFFFPDNQKHFIELGEENNIIPLTEELSLREYVKAHGLEIFESARRGRPFEESKRLMQKYIAKNGNINRIPEVKFASRNLNTEDKVFYSGGWYEEYIYYSLKRGLNIPDNQIAMKIKIRGRHSTNEYDIIFVKNDKIYVVECKAYFGKGNLKNKIENDLYKLAALEDEFGMRARALYFTTFDIAGRDPHVNEVIKKRAKELKIKLFQMEDMINEKFIKEIKSWFE